jgi:hypothetical protein
MKFIDIAKQDASYMAEMKAAYRGTLVTFIVVFYGLSFLAILTASGRQVAESLSTFLPNIIHAQYFILKGIDDKSHISYLISLPAILAIGAYYSYRLIVATRALSIRASPKGQELDVSASESTILCLVVLILLTVVLFSGTISGSRSSSDGWLLWPISGLVAFSAIALIVTAANSIYIAHAFKRTMSKGD